MTSTPNLTTGQRNALVALDAKTHPSHTGRYCRPEGVQERTLFSLVDLGLARHKTFVSGTVFRITVAGYRTLRQVQA